MCQLNFQNPGTVNSASADEDRNKLYTIYPELNSDIWEVVSGKSTLSNMYNTISLYNVNVSAIILLSLVQVMIFHIFVNLI